MAHWFLRGSRTTAMQCNARCWQLSRQDPSGTSHFLYLCVRLQDAQHVGPDAAGDPGGTPHHFFFSIAFAFFAGCLPVTAEYEGVCVSDRVRVCAWHLASSTTTLSERVSRNLPFPFLSLRVATLPKPAPTPCSRKIYVKLVTQRHASHTNQPLTYVSTVQGQRDDRSNLRPVSRREPKNSRR